MVKSTSECYFWLANRVSTDSNEYFLKFSLRVLRISFRPKKPLLGQFWSVKLIWYIFQIDTPQTVFLFFFSLEGPVYLQSHLLLGKYMWSQQNKTFFSKTRVTTFLGVFGLWFVQISVKPSTFHSTNISRLYFGIA